MSAFRKTRAAAEADGADSTPRCSCLPLCFLRGSNSTARSRRTEAAPGKRRRRFRLLRLSWRAFLWPWLRRSGKKHGAGAKAEAAGRKQRRGGRLLLLLKTSLQAKKALASVVVSGDGLLPLPATVSSFGDAKKQQNRSKPRLIADGAARPAPSGTRRQQLQACMTTAGTRGSAAPARPGTSQPCTPATTDEPALAARFWRAPSRRHLSPQQPDDRAERPATGGLWTAATTLGVIVLFGRVTAVFFLCSCLYGVRFVRLRAYAAGARAKRSGVAAASSSRRFRDPTVVATEKVAELCVTEECKKRVVMAGLLERPGQRTSSRFGR